MFQIGRTSGNRIPSSGSFESLNLRKPTNATRLPKNGQSFLNRQQTNIQSKITPMFVKEEDYINHLNHKYLLGDDSLPAANVKQQLNLLLECKTSEVEALRVHRDELRLICLNKPNQMPIKISLALLKEKAKTEEKICDIVNSLRKENSSLEAEVQTMEQYYKYVTNVVKQNGSGEDNVVIDTGESEQLLIDNLQFQTEHLLKELNQEDRKNAKELKMMQNDIDDLRILIHEKEERLKEAKAQICMLHIKLNARANRHGTPVKLPPTAPIDDKQQFVGYQLNRGFAKYLKDPNPDKDELIKLLIFYSQKNDSIYLQCGYRNRNGMVHDIMQKATKYFERENEPPKTAPDSLQKSRKVEDFPCHDKANVAFEKQEMLEIYVDTIISIRVCMNAKIVGLEFRVRGDCGERGFKVGKCHTGSTNTKLIPIGRNKITSIGSYWHEQSLIGLGLTLDKNVKRDTSVPRLSKDKRSFSGLAIRQPAQNIKVSRSKEPKMKQKVKSFKQMPTPGYHYTGNYHPDVRGIQSSYRDDYNGNYQNGNYQNGYYQNGEYYENVHSSRDGYNTKASMQGKGYGTTKTRLTAERDRTSTQEYYRV